MHSCHNVSHLNLYITNRWSCSYLARATCPCKLRGPSQTSLRQPRRSPNIFQHSPVCAPSQMMSGYFTSLPLSCSSAHCTPCSIAQKSPRTSVITLLKSTEAGNTLHVKRINGRNKLKNGTERDSVIVKIQHNTNTEVLCATLCAPTQ